MYSHVLTITIFICTNLIISYVYLMHFHVLTATCYKSIWYFLCTNNRFIYMCSPKCYQQLTLINFYQCFILNPQLCIHAELSNEHSHIKSFWNFSVIKNVLLYTYLYVCNALYNKRLTLITVIKLNSGQTEINSRKCMVTT